ncbi:MAG: hypothetical protein Fur0032_15540 [Terrimicrobiaceae bacterium]
MRSTRPSAGSASRAAEPAYTLVEMLIAGGILMAAIAAAALLASSVIKAQEGNEQVLRALNIQEQAARMYQLGLSRDQIVDLLPETITNSTTPPEGTFSLIFATNQVNVTGSGTLQVATNTLIFPVTRNNNGQLSYRTNTVIVVRPSIP